MRNLPNGVCGPATSVTAVDLGTAVGSAWSAGISLYGVCALLGIAGRLEWIDGPVFLEQTWVIGLALVLFAVELIVDKIAWIDSIWDAVHTFIRPIGGAAITSLAPGQELPLPVMLALGALLALSSHSAKASARAMINASPEPISNVVVSALEDGLVGVVMALAIAYPRVALVLTIFLAIASGLVAIVFFRFVRASWRRIRRWRDQRRERRAAW